MGPFADHSTGSRPRPARSTWRPALTEQTGTTPRALTAKALITPTGIVDDPLILLRDGFIERITTQERDSAPENTLHLAESTLSSGFLDVHVHGAGGRDVMEGTSEAIDVVARTLASYGTTRFLATTVTATIDHTLRALEAIADTIEADALSPGAATPIGIHLEGPFLSHTKRGVHTPALLQPPSIDLFDRFQQAARGHICLVTIAPELPGAIDLIKHAAAQDIRVSIGHSDGLASDAIAGIAAGATSATHTFNAMRGFTHREPGILGVVLDDDKLFAELICDGIHTTPSAVRMWLRMKGLERGMLVTDGMAATGMGDGDYLLGDMLAQVRDGVATHNGVLAGSVLTMDKAVENVQAFTGISLADAVRLASRNPASMLRTVAAPDERGPRADFNIFDSANNRIGTILKGHVL